MSSYYLGQCYIAGSSSFVFSAYGLKLVSRDYYASSTTCTGTKTNTVLFDGSELGKCDSDNGIAGVQSDGPVWVDNWGGYYEIYPNSCTDNQYINGRTVSDLSKPTICPNDEPGVNRQKTFIVSGTPTSLTADFNAIGCAYSNAITYQKSCASNARHITNAQATQSSLSFDVDIFGLSWRSINVTNVTITNGVTYNYNFGISIDTTTQPTYSCFDLSYCKFDNIAPYINATGFTNLFVLPVAHRYNGTLNPVKPLRFNIKVSGLPQIIDALFEPRTTIAFVTVTLSGGDTAGNQLLVQQGSNNPYNNGNSLRFQINTVPGSVNNMKFAVTNNGYTSAYKSFSFASYELVSPPVLTKLLQSGWVFYINWTASIGGVPQDTSYNVYLNGVAVSNCQIITTTYCAITLSNFAKYNVSVLASNDGYNTRASSFPIYDLQPLSQPTFTVSNLRTTTFTLSYASTGGNLNATTYYQILVNNNQVYNGTEKTFKMDTLTPGSTYKVKIISRNDIYSSIEATGDVTTYPLAKSILTVDRTKTQLAITCDSSGGVPNESIFDLSVNSTSLSCTQGQIVYYNLTPDTTYQVVLSVTNDGTEDIASKIFIVYKNPTPVSIKTFTSLNSVFINWTESTGGDPGKTIYNAYLSLGNVSWTPICSSISIPPLQCNYTGLLSNLTYYFKVVVTNNIYYDPVDNYSKATTRNSNNILCVDPLCSGHGHCSNGVCECEPGFNGEFCEKQTNGGSNGGTQVDPQTNQPLINITLSGTSYSFSLSTVREISSLGEMVKSIDLTNVTWRAVSQSTTSVINPEDQSKVKLNQWVYEMSTPTESVNDIQITFIQYLADESSNSKLDSINLEFALQTFPLKYGSVKYSLKIDEWNFDNQLNYLEVSTILTNPKDACATSSSNQATISNGETSGTTIITIGEKNGTHIYGRLINRALLDAIPRVISYKTIQNGEKNELVTVVPYFYNQCILDPDFSLLLDTKSERSNGLCSSSNNNNNSSWKVAVGVVIGVIGAAAIGVAVFVVVKKNLLIKKNNKSLEIKLNNGINNKN